MKKKTLVHVFRESTREAQKRNKRESSLVFERERRRARRRTRKRIVFTSSFQKFKRETKVPKTQDIIIITTNARKQRERKKEHI